MESEPKWLVLFQYDCSHTYEHVLIIVVDDKLHDLILGLKDKRGLPHINVISGHGNDYAEVEVEYIQSSPIPLTCSSSFDIFETTTYARKFKQQLLERANGIVAWMHSFYSESVRGKIHSIVIVGDLPNELDLQVIRRGLKPKWFKEHIFPDSDSMKDIDEIWWTQYPQGKFTTYSLPLPFPPDPDCFQNGALYDPDDEVLLLLPNTPPKDIPTIIDNTKYEYDVKLEVLTNTQALNMFNKLNDEHNLQNVRIIQPNADYSVIFEFVIMYEDYIKYKHPNNTVK